MEDLARRMEELALSEYRIEKLGDKISDLKSDIANASGTECEVYTRIVGYYRPIKHWNKGKAEEYKERHEFRLGDMG